MTAKEKAILKTFGAIVPRLTEMKKEKLLSYGEGIAFILESQEKKEKQESISNKEGERGVV